MRFARQTIEKRHKLNSTGRNQKRFVKGGSNCGIVSLGTTSRNSRIFPHGESLRSCRMSSLREVGSNAASSNIRVAIIRTFDMYNHSPVLMIREAQFIQLNVVIRHDYNMFVFSMHSDA